MTNRKFGIIPGGASPSAPRGGGGDDDVRERIARLETHVQYLAVTVDKVITKVEEANKNVESLKTSIANIKVWVLAGALGAVPIVMGLMLAFSRLLP